MSREQSRDRRARLHQFYETLPVMQRGLVICVLLSNALLVLTVDGVVGVAIARGIIRSWRHRRSGSVAAVRIGIGPALCGAMIAAALQWVVAEGLFRAVDTGRASAWLERGERWLTASAVGQNQDLQPSQHP
jgi:hypothetical protein